MILSEYLSYSYFEFGVIPILLTILLTDSVLRIFCMNFGISKRLGLPKDF